MSELKLMKCECCGGHIDKATLVCNMCGATYRSTSNCFDDDFTPVRLEVSHLKFETVSGKVSMPAYIIRDNPELGMEYSLREMAEHMVDKLMPLIEFQTEFDIRNNEYVTYGRLRVANPNKY